MIINAVICSVCDIENYFNHLVREIKDVGGLTEFQRERIERAVWRCKANLEVSNDAISSR